MAQGYFVTGTDTGVGKTLVACALLHGFAAAGRTVVGMKPVVAGRERGRWRDIDALLRASTAPVERDLASPYAFEPAIAPHIAADLVGVPIEIERIAGAYSELARRADVVIVEGVGGWLVPLNEQQTSADLAARLGLPVVLVVGMRLGCLNHALLTRRQIDASGLRCAGWVANCAFPGFSELQANIRALESRLGSPLLGVIPHLRGADPLTAAEFLSPALVAEASA